MFELLARIGTDHIVRIYGTDTMLRLTEAGYRNLQCEMNEWVPADSRVIASHERFVSYLV